MSIRRLIVAVVLVASASAVLGYEEKTHQTLTQAAVNSSVLQLNPAALADLGLKGVDDGTQTFPNSQNAPKTIANLFLDGADFEDGFTLIPLNIRVLRHFYDPITGRGLNTLTLGTQISSPDWALARPGNVPNQEFSYGNARQSLKDALTQPTEEARNVAFGRTFQALGQVVHHLQDMAQPQHVRNDVHCRIFALCAPIGAYSPSRYEHWTLGNLDNFLTDFSSIGYDITSPTFTSVFNSPRRFWHTESPDANSPAAGKGIAEFTNSNFVSERTNFRFNNGTVSTNPAYTRPAPGQAGTPTPVGELFPNGVPSSVQFGCRFDPDNCFMTFYSTPVTDRLTGEFVPNDRASTLSIFDQDLQANVQFTDPGTGENYSTQRFFALNSFNFRAAHQFLIPRAVAYSAGMINYFFRGKIDLVEDDDNLGTYLIKNLSSEPMTGTFALYYDYDDTSAGTVNNRKLLISWDKTVPANGQVSVGTIPFPFDPAPKNPDEFMLVFAGDMGQETRAEFGTGAVTGKIVTLTPVLMFAASRGESVLAPVETFMEFNFIFPEKYAQKIRSNPTAFSIRVGAVTSPATSVSVNPNGCFQLFFQIFPPSECFDLGGGIGGASNWRFFLTHNNEFVTWTPEQGVLLAGDSQQALTPSSRDRLCGSPVVNGNATQKPPFIDSTELHLTLEGSVGLVPIKVFLEGKVLFEFEASPAGNNAEFFGLDSRLSNAKNIRLTKVHCRVSMQ